MLAHAGKNFILVGHSLGADAILGATHIVGEQQGYGHIKGVMLLDAGRGLFNDKNDGYINNLISKGVPVAAFYSRAYWEQSEWPNVRNYKGGFAPSVILPSISVLAPYAEDHLDLAVNPNVFLQSGPIFYSWILMLGQ